MLPASKVQRLLYELYAYYAIFIGVTSYRYDYHRQCYKNSKWTQLIASLGNIFVIVLISMDIYYTCNQSFKLDTVTELTIRLDTIINDIICLLRVLQRLPRESATKEICQQLQRLQRIYCYRYRYRNGVRDSEIRMERIYLLKNCLLWVLLAFLMSFMLLTYEQFAGDLSYPIVGRILVVFYVLALDGQDVTIHMHFMLTWRICRLFKCLNNHIRELMYANDATVTLQLQHLRWQHWQLTKLMQRLNVTYNFTMISSRCCLIVTASALGYYLSIFHSLEYHFIYKLIAFAFYAIISLDCYLLDLMYDLTKHCHRQTSWQLRRVNELAKAESQLSRGCELFVLQIACYPLEIKPYGLFASGKSTWLSNIVCIFSWMIVLLQYRMASEKRML